MSTRAAAPLTSVHALSSRGLNSACCIVVLMLPPSHLTYSTEFKGSREKPEFLLQLRYVVSRNLCSLVIYKFYQILGVQKAKVIAVFPHLVFVLDTVQRRYWKPPMRIVVLDEPHHPAPPIHYFQTTRIRNW